MGDGVVVTYDDWLAHEPDNSGPPCDRCGFELEHAPVYANVLLCDDCLIDIEAEEERDERLEAEWPEATDVDPLDTEWPGTDVRLE